MRIGNGPLQEQIRQSYGLDCTQLPQMFWDVGLDDVLVCPSNQVDLSPIRASFRTSKGWRNWTA